MDGTTAAQYAPPWNAPPGTPTRRRRRSCRPRDERQWPGDASDSRHPRVPRAPAFSAGGPGTTRWCARRPWPTPARCRRAGSGRPDAARPSGPRCASRRAPPAPRGWHGGGGGAAAPRPAESDAEGRERRERGPPEDLVGQQVAHPGQPALVEEPGLERRPAAGRRRGQRVAQLGHGDRGGVGAEERPRRGRATTRPNRRGSWRASTPPSAKRTRSRTHFGLCSGRPSSGAGRGRPGRPPGGPRSCRSAPRAMVRRRRPTRCRGGGACPGGAPR